MFYLEVLRNQCGNHLHKFGWVFRRHVAQRRPAVLLPFRIGIVDEVYPKIYAACVQVKAETSSRATSAADSCGCEIARSSQSPLARQFVSSASTTSGFPIAF